jgi:hypothetical protein
MKVNILNHYPDAIYPQYLYRGDEIVKPEDASIFCGDIMYDKEHNAIGIVLGCIDEVCGELRLDSDGMQPIDNLRPATMEDFSIEDVGFKPSMKEELELAQNERKVYAVKHICNDKGYEKLVAGQTSEDEAMSTFDKWFPDLKALSARVCTDDDIGQFHLGLRGVKI